MKAVAIRLDNNRDAKQQSRLSPKQIQHAVSPFVMADDFNPLFLRQG